MHRLDNDVLQVLGGLVRKAIMSDFKSQNRCMSAPFIS